MQHRILLLTLLFAVGCGESELSMVDSGTPDSGTAPDTGTVQDTGTPQDTGTTQDTGTVADTGAAADSGDEADAGEASMDASDTDAGAMGACTNPTDEAIHSSTDVNAGVETCARDCFGGRPCTRQCIVDDVGLTEDCADCYAAITSCTIQNCLSECSGSDSAACEQCRDDSGCTAEFEMCAGF